MPRAVASPPTGGGLIQLPAGPLRLAPRGGVLRTQVLVDAPVSFLVAGPRCTPGEGTIVRVCIAPDRSIVSADIIESSGDKRFDDYALVWARQVRLRSAAEDGSSHGAPPGNCGEVRVEIRVPAEPRLISGADIALS